MHALVFVLALLVLLLATFEQTSAAYHFKRCNKTQRGLFVVRSMREPGHVKAYIDKHTYLTSQVEVGQQIDNYTLRVRDDINSEVDYNGYVWGVSVRTESRRFRVHGNCTVQNAYYNRKFVYCNESIMDQLLNRSDVMWITSIPRMRLKSYESLRLLTGNVDPPPGLWNGSGITILVSDSGLDTKHCGFYDPSNSVQIGSFAPNAHRKIIGIRSSVNDYTALNGAHGTSAAYVAAGYSCAGQSGVAPQAKIAFLDMSTTENGYLSIPLNLDQIIQNAINNGVTVHSASWGSEDNDGGYTDMDNVFDTGTFNNPFFGHVVAGGNSGPNGIVASPGSAKLVASVGGAYSRPSAYFPTSELFTYEQQLSFSSVGPLKDGRIAPLFLAPGYRVRTAYARSPPSSNNHADFHNVDGTSFAAPAIAGLAALIQQRYRSLYGTLPLWSTVISTMIAHAVPATRGGKLTSFGTPIMDWNAMIERQGIVSQTTSRYCFKVISTETAPKTWKISLAWIDVPSNPIASKTIINNLDMYVIAEDGRLLAEINDLENTFGLVSVPSQNVRIVVYARSLSTVNQYFSIHIRGLGNVTECQGNCIPTDFETCAGGRKTCVASTGLMSECRKQTCDEGYCGENCSTPCGLPCSVNGGTGALSNNSCVPKSCAHPLFITQTSCVCAAETGVSCNTAWSLCSNNAFLACAPPASTPSVSVSGDLYSAEDKNSLMLIVCTVFYILVLM